MHIYTHTKLHIHIYTPTLSERSAEKLKSYDKTTQSRAKHHHNNTDNKPTDTQQQKRKTFKQQQQTSRANKTVTPHILCTTNTTKAKKTIVYKAGSTAVVCHTLRICHIETELSQAELHTRKSLLPIRVFP